VELGFIDINIYKNKMISYDIMKAYTSRVEYEMDVELLKKTIMNPETCSQCIDELFHQWKDTSPDSPWYDDRELMKQKESLAVDTLIKISEEGSSEWCGEHILFNDLK
jgi:hypothetical protein